MGVDGLVGGGEGGEEEEDGGLGIGAEGLEGFGEVVGDGEVAHGGA